MGESLKDQRANIHGQVPKETETPLNHSETQAEKAPQSETGVSGHEVHNRGDLTNGLTEKAGEIIPPELTQENAWQIEDERLETEVISLSEVIGTRLREAATLIQKLNGMAEAAPGEVTGLSEAIEEAKQQVEDLLVEKAVLESTNTSDREAGMRGGLSDGYIEKRRKTLDMFQNLDRTTQEVLEELKVVVTEASDNKQKAPVKQGKIIGGGNDGEGSGNGGDGGDGNDNSVEESSVFARDYSEEDILKIWDHLPETPEGVVEKIAIIREQIERTKSLTQEIRELGSDERLTNQLFEEIHVPVQVVKKRDGQSEQEAFMERKSSIQHLTWPDKLARVEATLEEMEERLQAGELTDRDVNMLRIKHLDFHRLLSALEKIVEETRVEREQETPLVAAEQAARKEKKLSDHESEQEEYRLFGEKLSALDEKLNEWIRVRRELLTQLGDENYGRFFFRKLPQDLKMLIKKEVMQEVVDRMADYKKAFQEGHIPGKREWNWVEKHLEGLEMVIERGGTLQQKIEKGEFAQGALSDSVSSPETGNNPEKEKRAAFEKLLEEKVASFVEIMDKKIRSQDEKKSFARRLAMISAHVPELVEKIIETAGTDLSLSPDEQNDMIEASIKSIHISR